MKKRWLALVLAAVLLTGCGARGETRQVVDYSLFDTVTTVMAAEDRQDFPREAQALLDQLGEYHRLFDIYHEYEGLVNLKTVNENAAQGPVKIDPRLMEFLLDCKEYEALTHGRVDPAMGAVLKLWHQAREDSLRDPDHSYLPEPEALKAAGDHCSMEDVILDPQAGTVYFADPDLSLDPGALGKGWAAERVCQAAPEGYLLSVGGNVRCTGLKGEALPWTVGIQDPDAPGAYLLTFPLSRGSAVTSGDYQRYFTVDGKNYHHIIDPDTGMPGQRWRSVTVVTADSGLADCLSTALFLMDYEEGLSLLQKTDSQALWIDPEGNILKSPDFPE